MTVLVQNIVVLHIVCKFPSRLSASLSYWSRLSFSSSRWSYQRSNAKFGVPNGLDQPFATKLPAATAHSEICERKTRMDFRFAHLCKITAISKGNKHPDFLHQVSETILYSPILNFATNNIALVQNVCQNLLDVQLFSMLTNFFQFCGLLNVHHRHIDSCREIWFDKIGRQSSNSPSAFLSRHISSTFKFIAVWGGPKKCHFSRVLLVRGRGRDANMSPKAYTLKARRRYLYNILSTLNVKNNVTL